MLITRAGRHRVDSVFLFCRFWFLVCWFCTLDAWFSATCKHESYGKLYGTKVVQFFFRVELHNIVVEISFQLASFKSTRRESTRSVRECISTGREFCSVENVFPPGAEKFWSVENVFPAVENFGRSRMYFHRSRILVFPPVGRSRISQANSAGQQAFPVVVVVVWY